MVTGEKLDKGKSKYSQRFMVFAVLLGTLLLVMGILVACLAWFAWSEYQADVARHAHDRLIRTDPIVGIWQSHDTSSGELFDHNNLTIYNDHTYVIYDQVNHTSIEGTWEKTRSYYTTDIYTMHEKGRTFPPITLTHGRNSGYMQYTYTYRDSPPDSVIEYVNYELVDYYLQ